jgi:hypothetical protein
MEQLRPRGRDVATSASVTDLVYEVLHPLAEMFRIFLECTHFSD